MDSHWNEFVRLSYLVKRHRKGGVSCISHELCKGGRQEMLNELNRSQVRTIYWFRFHALLGNRKPLKESQ